MWVYKSDDPKVIKGFFHMTHEDIWQALVKPQQGWPAEDKERGLDDNTPPVEEWLAKAKNINEPSPVHEDPRSDLLTAMLVLMSYTTSEPKKK
ncbi:wall-associated receptor kinase 3 [Hordeum vulgare]|nr:wall-associated receptor kinase 3 [Hordeum vulgare]